MGYWDRTDNILKERGGRAPFCPNCGKEMFAADDHGRFTCFCRLGKKPSIQFEEKGKNKRRNKCV